ncbi:hypothetical protein KUTeg_003142 [Tegillarca granosa]|uniref:Uncharacterized protein n=1 Tax=Tegillarca granosa TaxID=220873 RepID=A0ABQ9FL98_TEGGR|nr:hypothetical protein KUTeg_003142 [Tegillarca granosa]
MRETTRLLINQDYIAKFIISNGGLYIEYPEIIQSNVGMFDNNKVHLSQLGNDIFLYLLQQAIQVFITSNSKVSPPNGEPTTGLQQNPIMIKDEESELTPSCLNNLGQLILPNNVSQWPFLGLWRPLDSRTAQQQQHPERLDWLVEAEVLQQVEVLRQDTV